MDARDGGSISNRSRLDQFYQSKKKRESPKSAKSPSGRRKSLDDTSPYKKGSLDGFIISSRSPSSQSANADARADDGRDIRPSIKTSLCNRIEESTRTTNFALRTCSDAEVKHNTGLAISSSSEQQQHQQQHTEAKEPSAQSVKLNEHLTPFANDFLSICLSGASPSEDQPPGKKRELPALANPASKKRLIDVAETITKENMEVEASRRSHMKVDCDEVIPSVTPGARKQLSSKPPFTPHTLSNKKGSKLTPNGSSLHSKYCSPGDAFWDEAIKVTNALLDPQAAEQTNIVSALEVGLANGGSTSLSSPLPIRRFTFSQENEPQAQEEQEPPTESETKKQEQQTKTMAPEEHKELARTEQEELPKTDLRYWLPKEVCDVFAKKGLRQLYEWQVECLLLQGVLDGRSLVYCASTSAGKSLVAEILMLRKVISSESKAILVLPYVALCSEKAEHLESLLEPLGKRVRCFFGHQGSGTLPPDTSVAVCTIEKANSLVNKLIEEGRLSELAVVVIDELHMVGDRDRGYLLELMLTKLRYAAGSEEASSQRGNLQILGMSATMPNVQAVASWLEALFYQTNFRPVPLHEYIKVGRVIYNTNMETVRVLREGADLGGKDQEHVVELCNEVVREGHSALLFCSSRHACETSARHVAKFLPKFAIQHRENQTGFKDGNEAVKELQKCPAGLDPVLADTLPAGVAYHHAGLTAEEREVVEACYRQGVVRVLAATSTLAAGVNLPARRVIFRQPKVGCDFLDATRYRQMAGRAGRAGIDTLGESVLICKPEEVNRMLPILKEGCQPLRSCLSEDKNGMMRALLEVVAGGIVQTSRDVDRYVRSTLLNSTQRFENVAKSAQESLRWLCHKRLIEWDNELQVYRTTPLGKAAFGSSLTPEESLVVFEDLAKARESFVLASDLHVVYEVTPIYVELEPDWGVYYQKFLQLSHVEQAVANRVGVTEAFLMRMAHGAPVQPGNRMAKGFTKSSTLLPAGGQQNPMDQTMRVYRRFYVAIILSKLVQEVPLMEVCTSFRVPRGTVQALQDSSGRFAAMVATFCERLGWHDLEGLVSKFQNRVSFGVRAEVASLTEIPFVKAARARALYQAGLRTIQAVAEASISVLTTALFDVSSKTFQDGSRQQWLHAAMAKRIKNGARKIVLDQAEEARKAAFSAFQALGVTVPKSLSEPIRAGVLDFDTDAGILAETVKQEATRGNMQIDGGNRDSDDDHRTSSYFQGSVINHLAKTEPVNVLQPRSEDKGPVDVDRMEGGFEAFMAIWQGVKEFFFDLHYEREAGGMWEIVGVAICWNDSPVHYVGIGIETNLRWSKLCGMFHAKGLGKVCWDLKRQMKAFEHPGFSADTDDVKLVPLFQSSARKLLPLTSVTIEETYTDVRVVAWLLWPDEESNATSSLEQLVKKRLPGDLASASARAGRWTNQMGKVTHNGCCRRVAQVRALHSVLWKLVVSEGLHAPLQQLEMPLVKVLVSMESWPIGVDMKACVNARELLELRIRQLESKAQVLTGMNFSLSLPSDVADLLYKHLKLPVPPGCKGKQHPSTDKQALENLRDKHPVVSLIKEHRSLSKLLHTTIGTVSSCAKRFGDDAFYIVGQWLHTSTGTGRLSMEEPNLQCVEHSLSFILEDVSNSAHQQVEVVARDFFIPTQANWVLLSADYSQIELRLMAHFSEDEALIALLKKPTGDLFRMMTAQWTGQTEASVSDKQREQTKRMVYGILYGMGINTLAERMECSVAEARNYHDRFKAAFPGVNAWLQEAVQTCRQNGHVKTISGRKRYLEKINNSKRGDQAKAERQAVNSICQGSAADLIKLAMIDLYAAISGSSSKTTVYKDASGRSRTVSFSMLQGRCRLLLQIHDELLLEVDKELLGEASAIIRVCMEGAASLKVPLNVKLQSGPSWGQLRPLKSD